MKKKRTIRAQPGAKTIAQWLHQADCHRRQGNFEEALATYQAALKTEHRDPGIYFGLANIHADMGNLKEAVSSLSRAVEIRPDWGLALHNLGSIYQRQGRVSKALNYYIQALKAEPLLAEAHNNIGVILNQHQQVTEALAAFDEALKIKPHLQEARINLGIAKNAIGDNEGAQECFQQVLSTEPKSAKAFYHMIGSRKTTPDQAAPLLQLATRIEEALNHQDDFSYFSFAMGKLLDELGEYDKAYGHYYRGNKLERQKCHFDLKAHHHHISAIMETFSADLLNRWQAFGNLSCRPVFIVGMPRSGTTLVEQIICSHPAVYGAGELDFFARFEDPQADKFGLEETHPHLIAKLTSAISAEIADQYLLFLRKLPGIAPHHQRVTNKMPLNALMLGFIYTLFPNAHIIHCRRNPLDTCLSIFMTKFEQSLPFAFDLVETAIYYRDYRRLMDHWRTVLPTTIHEVCYETLVQSPDVEAKALIQSCTLEWDPRCMNFTQNKRPIQTASYWQARQPIYKTSAGRWRNYVVHMGSAIEILAGLED